MKLKIQPYKFAIYAFFFSLNFETLNTFNLGIDYLASKITISLLLLFFILNFKPVISVTHFTKFIFPPILLFFILLTILSFLNKTADFPFLFDTQLFLNILIFIILCNYSISNPGIMLKGIFVFALGCLLVSLLFFSGIFVEKAMDGRIMMFGENANGLGIKASISLLIFIYFIINKKLDFGKNRFILLFFCPFLFNLMISTGSRVALLSFIVGFVVFLDPFKYSISTKKILILLSILPITFLLWYFYLKDSYVIKRLMNSIFKGDMSNRDIIWSKTMIIIKENLFFGVGKTGYAFEISKQMGTVTSPHNVILEVLCYSGILGLILFLIFFLQIIFKAIRKYRFENDLLSIALLIPIFGMMLTGQILDQKIGWILLAFVASETSIKTVTKHSENKYKV